MFLCVMDSQSIVKTLKGNSTLPLHYIPSNSPTFKDASLSLSLSSSLKLPKDPPLENGIDETHEISIFDAHKYFNETNDDSKGHSSGSSHDLLSAPRLYSVDGYSATKSFRSAPTPSSEVSWNSHTGLLPNPPPSIFTLNCIYKRWHAAKKWFFKRKCCCKSVRVKDDLEQHKRAVVVINTNKIVNISDQRDQSCKETRGSILEIHHIKSMASSPLSSTVDAPRQHRISASGRCFIDGAVGFTFPILNPSDHQPKPIINPLEDSVLEAFKPIHELPSMDNPIDDDVESDASSDLFEIETLSTRTTSACPVYRGRISVDQNRGEEGGITTDLSALWEEAEGKMEALVLMGCGQEEEAIKHVATEGPPMLANKPPFARVSLAFAA